MLLYILMLLGIAMFGGTYIPYYASDMARARRTVRGILRRVRKASGRLHAVVADADLRLLNAGRDYASATLKRRLQTMPIEDLRRLGVTHIRWAALRSAGLTTIDDIKGRSAKSLLSIPGVGSTTAYSVKTAAEALVRELEQEGIALPKPDSWTDADTRRFAMATATVLTLRDSLGSVIEHVDNELTVIGKHCGKVEGATRFRDWLFRRWDSDVQALVVSHVEAARSRQHELASSGHLDPPAITDIVSEDELRSDFLQRFADYAALMEQALHKVGPRKQYPSDYVAPGSATHLPLEVARRIEGFPLHTPGLRVQLRMYQEFGTKYLLAQKRTILGDEMGLGKTIQALAAMVHLDRESLSAPSARRFLVVCPASIIPNWSAEIARRTDLQVHILRTRARIDRFRSWIAHGGVAIVSYNGLDIIAFTMREEALRIDLSIVDEAHYAKNPMSGRAIAVKWAAEVSQRVCLMTGTPLENRFSEFRHLVSIVSPTIAADLPLVDNRFTRIGTTVAPIYLRRRQSDVLRELPEKIEKEEWLDLLPEDVDAYRDAVFARNYMAMRRAVTIGKGHRRSAKLRRLSELLAEYQTAEKKVIMFSYFLDVLDHIASDVSPIGILRGSVPAIRRQEIVDRFQTTYGHAVLLSQIEAGGIGINVQAASVVVLMEPQWKPSTENQAIARAHRMGQVERVVVHRLYARNSVDERMVSLLRHKQALFDQHVQDSELKHASRYATERGFAKRVIEVETARFNKAAASGTAASSISRPEGPQVISSALCATRRAHER